MHLLELLKYSFPDDNKRIDDPLEMWLYLLRTAMNSKSDELLKQLPDPVFEEAVGVLQMIQRSTDERRLYQARLKAKRDAASNVDAAVTEAVENERIKAEKNMVRMLQEILKLPVSSDSDLANETLEDLKGKLAALRKRVLDR